MKLHLKRLGDRVIVITGASSEQNDIDERETQAAIADVRRREHSAD